MQSCSQSIVHSACQNGPAQEVLAVLRRIELDQNPSHGLVLDVATTWFRPQAGWSVLHLWGMMQGQTQMCPVFQVHSVWTLVMLTCAAARLASPGGTAKTTWTTVPPPHVPTGAPAGTA